MGEIVLASGSAVRARMLAAAGLRFSVERPEVDERDLEVRFLGSGGALADLPAQLAAEKALAVSRQRPEAWVIGADQVLSSASGEALAKVASMDAARDRLRRLQGRAHRLRTGAAIARGGQVLASTLEEVEVALRAVDDAELDRYLERAGAAVTGSVSCYEIEGFGAALIDRLEGDYFSALGLPLFWVFRTLRAQGAAVFPGEGG